ncbi:MAG: ComF family protein [Prevotella sp.]|nr:ComF family protein [Prevotella sp.]
MMIRMFLTPVFRYIIYYFRALFDFLAPRYCPICRRRLAINEEFICVSCDWGLPRTDFPDHAADSRLTRLLTGRYTLVRAASWLYYRTGDRVGMMMKEAKYSGRRDICRWLGTAAATEFLPKGFFEGIDVIVPVPLTKSRKRNRGYNQSEEIARGVSEATGIKVMTDAVRRTHFIKSQTLLSPSERMANVGNAFKLIRPERLRGKHILLIDDIITTGATMMACALEIAKAGDVSISIMSIYKVR